MIVDLFDRQLFDLIQQLAGQDAFDASLRLKNYPPEIRTLVGQQISARKKAIGKIPEWCSAQVIFPWPASVEQASSSVTARYKSEMIRGGMVIDLTGGMGVDTWGFSTSSEHVIYVEKEPELCEIAKYNFKRLGITNVTFHNQTATSFLTDFKGKADFVYIDPSRRKNNRRFFRLEDAEPDISALLPTLKKITAVVIMKASPFADMTYLRRVSESISEIQVIAAKNECKELLLVFDFQKKGYNPAITAVNLSGKGNSIYRSNFEKERKATVSCASSGKYLFDPDPAVRKAGLFNSVALDFNLKKLAPNSHIYLDTESRDNFPGRIYRIDSILTFRELAKRKQIQRAHILIRNFPETLENIRKRTGIRDGGDIYLVASRDMHNNPLFFVTRI